MRRSPHPHHPPAWVAQCVKRLPLHFRSVHDLRVVRFSPCLAPHWALSSLTILSLPLHLALHLLLKKKYALSLPHLTAAQFHPNPLPPGTMISSMYLFRISFQLFQQMTIDPYFFTTLTQQVA